MALVGFIVFMERAQRRLFVTYPKRQVGNKVYGGDSSHLPLKLNVSGVIPPIFASSILLLPTTYASFNAQNLPGWLQIIVTYLSRGQPLYLVAVCGADPVLLLLLHLHRLQSGRDGGESEEVWRRLSRHPARQEERPVHRLYADPHHRDRRAVSGLRLPDPGIHVLQIQSVSFSLGGTSILIVVSVTMDTVAQIQSHLVAQQYEGLLKKSKLRGARR